MTLNLHHLLMRLQLPIACAGILPFTAFAQHPTPPPELMATEWRLVEVLSMDGSRFAPAASDTGPYTLTFLQDGEVVIAADCNRGKTSLQSMQPPGLKFTRIAVTRAQCSPPSVSGRFLDQLPWVRSYDTRDGRLYLATAAEATILEFSPLDTGAE